MLIAASILLGLAAGISANAAQSIDIQLTVANKIQEDVYIGRTDEEMFTIVCAASKTSADLVFQGLDGVIVWENYGSRWFSRDTRSPRPGYRHLDQAGAKSVCNDPYAVYNVRITDSEAVFTKIEPLKAQAFARKIKNL